MTLEEAQHVAEILSEADGGCQSCARRLFELAQNEFPQFEWHYWSFDDPAGAPLFVVTER